MRVLLADDEAMIRMGLRAMLADAGHAVVGAAPNGRQAITLAQTTKPDLIILDIQMPNISGLEAAREIMAQRPTPIVMLTAFSERKLVEQANQAVVFAYLVKPIKEELLTPTLDLALARFKEWQALHQEADQLQQSLQMRDLIAQAKFALMEREGLSEHQAFLKIHYRSRERRVPMSKVAEEILRKTKR